MEKYTNPNRTYDQDDIDPNRLIKMILEVPDQTDTERDHALVS